MSGHYEKLEENFKRLISNNRLSHAYLFFGGDKGAHQKKFILAQSLANFLENGIFEKPENILKETLTISSDEKGVIGIDKIRTLRYYLWQKPTVSNRRLVIIENAENLTPEAQNAALKIVEEPPEYGLIIFISKTSEDLLSTLVSRTQKIYFTPLLECPALLAQGWASEASSINLSQGLMPCSQVAGFTPETQTNTNQIRINSDKNLRKSDLNLSESVLSEAEEDRIFEDLLLDLLKDKINNSQKLKELLRRLTLMKQFNTNKKLQWRSLDF